MESTTTRDWLIGYTRGLMDFGHATPLHQQDCSTTDQINGYNSAEQTCVDMLAECALIGKDYFFPVWWDREMRASFDLIEDSESDD